MKIISVVLLMLSVSALAEEIHYPPIEYDAPTPPLSKNAWYKSEACKDPVNLLVSCKSKRLLLAEAKQKVFLESHKQCTKWKYVKLNESCKDKPSVIVKSNIKPSPVTKPKMKS
jgi:hypothetical protein